MQICPHENSLSISHNASRSCHNFMVVQLQHKKFYSIDPSGDFSFSLEIRKWEQKNCGRNFRGTRMSFRETSTRPMWCCRTSTSWASSGSINNAKQIIKSGSIFWRLNSFLKKWANLGLFFVYFCLFKQTLQFLQQKMWKMSIQYPAPGFELTTFWLRVSSLNH